MKPYYETDLGKLYHGDCLEIMPHLEPVDLVVTSPPYDNLRDYEGYTFDFEKVANGLYGIVSVGGVVVWVVGDATINGSETGTSFKQALYFKDIGFNLFDTMIYHKYGLPMRGSLLGYNQTFEYMFVLSSGKPKTTNIIKDRPNATSGTCRVTTNRGADGKITDQGLCKTMRLGRRENVWSYTNGFLQTSTDKIAFEHPAIFPEGLARDHILSWSNINDTVLDPFFGSGTVAKMCEAYNRRWIGIEIEERYCQIAAERIERERQQHKLPGF